MRRSLLAFALALPAVVLAPPLLQPTHHEAAASVSIALSTERLAELADSVAMAEAQESQSRWEDGRIITLTRMRLVEKIAGDSPREFWVRALGGEVDGIGQLVEGEPTFSKGQRSLVFLRHTALSHVSAPVGFVVGRAQGLFFVREQDGVRQLRPHHDLGVILRGTLKGPLAPDSIALQPAGEFLAARELQDALREVRAAWVRHHPPAAASKPAVAPVRK